MSWLSALGLGKRKKEEWKKEDWQTEEGHICGYTALSDRGEEIGAVSDYIVDNNDRVRYLVISLALEGMGKKITVPVGIIDVDDRHEAVIVSGITQAQLESMPAYDEERGFSDEYETSVMSSYYPNQTPEKTEQGRLDYDRYAQFRAPERIRLLEERLMVNKRPELQGEARVGKHVETQQESVEVPLMREKLVIERTPADETTVSDTENMTMQDEAITVPLYKEEVEVTKRTVLAEEVSIRKEQETETETVTETVAREHLDVDDPTQQRPASDRDVTPSERSDTRTERNEERTIEVEIKPLDENK